MAESSFTSTILKAAAEATPSIFNGADLALALVMEEADGRQGRNLRRPVMVLVKEEAVGRPARRHFPVTVLVREDSRWRGPFRSVRIP